MGQMAILENHTDVIVTAPSYGLPITSSAASEAPTRTRKRADERHPSPLLRRAEARQQQCPEGRVVTNHFERLGVSPDATSAEIASAYRDMARILHPDTQPDATPAQRARFTAMMAEVNEAWTVLKDDRRRAEYRASLEAAPGGTTAPTVRHPRSDECETCGSFPAANMRFRHQRAWLFAATVYEAELRLCQGCGVALGRSAQNRTMWLGWWGVFSFLRNIGYVFGNAQSLRRAAGLAAPRRRNDPIFTPLLAPLPTGRPVWQRTGMLATTALFVALFAIVVGASDAEESSRTTTGSRDPVASAGWEVGSCVSGFTTVVPVPCSSPHSGRIVEMSLSGPDDCPMSTESYVVDGAKVWCIDDDR